MAAKNKEQVKKEFNEFADKVTRLESLRQQLNVLDTRGFETDARLIKAKLKDINAIPQITRELGVLRKKIEKSSAAKPRGVSRESRKEHRKVLEEAKGIKRKLNEERTEVLKQTSSMKRRISELQELIKKKRRISVKKQLNDKEVNFVRDIPKLEKELGSLTDAFKKHTSSAKLKIDSGVGIMVDTKFDDFIMNIKADLSHKLKEKEMSMDSVLEHNLEDVSFKTNALIVFRQV